MTGSTVRRFVIPAAVLGIIGALWIANAASEPDRGLVFSEDFATDPGWTSLEEMYVFCDGSGGGYFAMSHDVSTGYANFLALSPEFEFVDGSFTLSFDMAVLEPQWGQYPGLYLLNTMQPDPTGPAGFHDAMSANYSWSDAVPRRFRIRTDAGHLVSEASPEVGRWYRFELSYRAATARIDWRVVDLETASIFHEVEEADFVLNSGFNCIAVGERTAPPSYGDYSAIRVDNISVWQDGGTTAEQSTWGAIKSKYR